MNKAAMLKDSNSVCEHKNRKPDEQEMDSEYESASDEGRLSIWTHDLESVVIAITNKANRKEYEESLWNEGEGEDPAGVEVILPPSNSNLKTSSVDYNKWEGMDQSQYV